MIEREATCRCGALRARCRGEPVRVSVCHCLDCQKRSGSAFAVQARFPVEQVEIIGAFETWTGRSTGPGAGPIETRFCGTCGGTVAFIAGGAETIAIPVGAFADPGFPGPGFSVFESRRHAWAAVLGDDVER